MENLKVYVDVLVKMDKDGDMTPVEFVWEDGTTYQIDQIKNKERCASRKAGGTGIRYTAMVGGKECHLEVVLKYAFILTNVCLIELLRRKQYQI